MFVYSWDSGTLLILLFIIVLIASFYEQQKRSKLSYYVIQNKQKQLQQYRYLLDRYIFFLSKRNSYFLCIKIYKTIYTYVFCNSRIIPQPIIVAQQWKENESAGVREREEEEEANSTENLVKVSLDDNSNTKLLLKVPYVNQFFTKSLQYSKTEVLNLLSQMNGDNAKLGAIVWRHLHQQRLNTISYSQPL